MLLVVEKNKYGGGLIENENKNSSIYILIMVHTKHDHAVFMTLYFLGSWHEHGQIIVNMVTCCENEVAEYENKTQ